MVGYQMADKITPKELRKKRRIGALWNDSIIHKSINY
jgi:hypothetical protein